MAWRIHDNVIRGEIDNRRRGVVKGRIWLRGYSEPLALELKGNAAPDLAGCLLTFENTKEAVALDRGEGLHPDQVGTIGDMTASRKVRVLGEPGKENTVTPEQMANCLYLEWYSNINGRIVVESTDYRLAVSPPCWRLTAEEEAQRRDESGTGFVDFMQRLGQALAGSEEPAPEKKEWDEYDYERFMRECEARTTRYDELLDKYRDHPERDQIIAREMGWTDAEVPEEKDDETKEGAEAWSQGEKLKEGEAKPAQELDPATEGLEWMRDELGQVHHPLAFRVFEGSCAFWANLKELGLHETADDDLAQLRDEYQITAVKLTGALGPIAARDATPEGAFTVACLKRALSHLHNAQAALERAAAKKLLAEEVLNRVRSEFFSVREEILRLMKRFRSQ